MYSGFVREQKKRRTSLKRSAAHRSHAAFGCLTIGVDLRVKRIAQTVAQKVEGKHREEDRNHGKDRRVRRGEQVSAGFVKHCTPFRHRRLSAEPHAAVMIDVPIRIER